MNVKTRWLVLPIVLAILLIVGAVWGIQSLNLDDTTEPYTYRAKLFNEEEVGIIELEMSEDDWTDMMENPLEETYKEANITINGETISNVAVRTKGNSSLTSVANSESNRYSLKIDFNYYDSSQTYYGLKKLNLNNNFSDSTQMKEFVSYELMEQIGITTPAHSYMKVIVNGEYYGLMLGVEAVDETFIAQNYNTTNGYLFKPDGTGSDLKYFSDDFVDYTGIEVKMGEKDIEDSTIISMMKKISEGDTSSLNTDQVLRYFALNTALVNLDSYQGNMKHNYYLYENEDSEFSIIPWDYNMSFGGFGMGMGGNRGNQPNQGNNEQSLEKEDASMDEQTGTSENVQDMSNMSEMPNMDGNMPEMGERPNMGEGGMPNMSEMPNMDGNMPEMGERPDMGEGGMPNMSEMPNMDGNMPEMGERPNMGDGGLLNMGGDMMSEDNINFSIYEPVSGTTLEERPLLKVLLEDEQLLAQYEDYLEQIATEILTEENVSAITSKLASILPDYIEEDPTKFSTTDEFLAGVSGENSLPEFAKQRSASILAQLSGELVVENTSASMSFPNMNFPEGNGPNQNQEQPKEMFGMNEANGKAEFGGQGNMSNLDDDMEAVTKEDVLYTGLYLLLAAIAIFIVRKIGR